jgi:hypothetical protein
MGRKPRDESPQAKARGRRRAMRARPTPKWLGQTSDLDEIARRRCLMVLSVLSGERAVTEVIEEAQISRGMYYQLETKALNAMLRALAPGGDGESDPAATTSGKRIAELEAQVKRLEQEKRRAEHLLHMSRQLMRPGPVTTGRGRPRKDQSSKPAGSGRLPLSPRKPTSPAALPSTPTSTGSESPSNGRGSL